MAIEEQSDGRWKITIDGDPDDPETQQLADMMRVSNPEAVVVVGEVRACERCQHLSCVCAIETAHEVSCRYRRAATSSVAVACNLHDREVCPECDRCTCDPGEP